MMNNTKLPKRINNKNKNQLFSWYDQIFSSSHALLRLSLMFTMSHRCKNERNRRVDWVEWSNTRITHIDAIEAQVGNRFDFCMGFVLLCVDVVVIVVARILFLPESRQNAHPVHSSNAYYVHTDCVVVWPKFTISLCAGKQKG